MKPRVLSPLIPAFSVAICWLSYKAGAHYVTRTQKKPKNPAK